MRLGECARTLKIKSKFKLNTGGQECPPHITLLAAPSAGLLRLARRYGDLFLHEDRVVSIHCKNPRAKARHDERRLLSWPQGRDRFRLLEKGDSPRRRRSGLVPCP